MEAGEEVLGGGARRPAAAAGAVGSLAAVWCACVVVCGGWGCRREW